MDGCEVISRAIQILETEGWTQGNYYKEGEGYCLWGALYKAAGRDYGYAEWLQEDSKNFNRDGVQDAWDKLSPRLKIRGYNAGAAFNDTKSTTKDDVIALLKEACDAPAD